jgi:GLPGLI family protein
MSYFVFSQVKPGNSSDLWVSYQLNYKKFAPKNPLKTNAILIVTNQGSLFTFEAMMNFDKIQQEESSQRLMCFSIDHPLFFDKTNGESTEHYETIGSDAYKFKENLNHNWKLIKQDTIMSGYVCKKATVNYARDWSAWYNPDIPITVGPINFMDYLDW